jgi:hypothetical protein
MSEAAEDEGDDSGALAAVGCLRAISTILESVSSLPHLFGQVEPTLMPIMRRMLTSDGQGTFNMFMYAPCVLYKKLHSHLPFFCILVKSAYG